VSRIRIVKGKMDPEDIFTKYGSAFDRLADASSPSDIFSRQFGTELTQWEMSFLHGFSEHLRGQKYLYRGFVRHTRNSSLILLTPSPWLLDGEFVFFESNLPIPDDGSYIEVIGKRVAVPSVLQQSQIVLRALAAESSKAIPLSFAEQIAPPLSLRQLSSLLFERVGMAEASKQVFARLFVSSPPYQNAIGGLTTGIQAIASRSDVRRFLSFIRRVLPPSMRNRTPAIYDTRGMKITSPKIFRVDVGSIPQSHLEKICVERRDPSGFREVSVGTLTEANTATLPDIPLALASEDFWIEARNPIELQLPILKSAITYQLLSPRVSQRSIDTSTSYVLSRLESLQESFGLREGVLARGNVLDADSLGRPLSVLRIARSTARASWSEKVTSSQLKQSWDRVLEPALKEFIELSETKKTAEKEWGEGSRIEKFNTKVLKAIRKLDSGKRGYLGPTLDEIAQEASVERYVAAETLAKMKDSGVLYEPRPGHYRLV
jgi:hypothetical protein